MSPNRHASIEVMYVEAGQCTFTIEQGEVTLGKGEFLFLCGQALHGMALRQGDALISNIEFIPEQAAAQCASARSLVDLHEISPLLMPNGTAFVLRDEDLTVLPLLKGIIEELDLQRWGSEQVVQLRLWELAIAVTRLSRRDAEETAESRHIRQAKEFLARHYAESITIEEVAGQVRLSRSYLQRLFHRQVGLTPNEYLTQQRLRHAQTLLTRTDLPLIEVAARVGFESQQYLNALFRKNLGVTPGQFRQGITAEVTIDDNRTRAKTQICNTTPVNPVTVNASTMPKRCSSMPKIVMLGAGSGFTSNLAKDIALIPGLDSGVFALVDIDEERLKLAHHLVEKVIALTGKDWTVISSTDRREVMADADYITNTIEVSGVATVGFDNDIPLKYGIDQCIGDTIGPGGVMKVLRTIPAWVEILRDAEVLCPRALVMNYTNPMSMMTLAATKVTKLPVVGLCHSVQGTSKQLAEYLGIPYEELVWECAGINHMAWFTKLEHHGVDQYPLLREKAADPEIYEKDPVRLEMMLHFGAFVTESSGHFSEYLPYFRKRKDLIEKYCREGYLGGSGFYANSWPQWRKENDAKVARLASGEEQYEMTRSHEYASVIIEAHHFNKPAVIHGNVLNTGLIDNLPADGVVEVPVLIDNTGYHPCHFGKLPPQMAALNRANMAVFELGVEAALNSDPEAAIHAMMVDPLSAAVCSPAEIRAMANELFEAEADYLPFKKNALLCKA